MAEPKQRKTESAKKSALPRESRSMSPQSRTSPKPTKIHGFIMASHPLLGSFTHAPRSNYASARYFDAEIVPAEEHERRKELRNNPFTGQFHTGPKEYSHLHNLKQFGDASQSYPINTTHSFTRLLASGDSQQNVSQSTRTFANRGAESTFRRSRRGSSFSSNKDERESSESAASNAQSDSSTAGLRNRSQSAGDDSTGWRSECSEVSSPRSTMSGARSPRFRTLSGSLSPTRRSRRSARSRFSSPVNVDFMGDLAPPTLPSAPPLVLEPENPANEKISVEQTNSKSRSRANTTPDSTRRSSRKSLTNTNQTDPSAHQLLHSRRRSQSTLSSSKKANSVQAHGTDSQHRDVVPETKTTFTRSLSETVRRKQSNVSAGGHSPPAANYYATTGQQQPMLNLWSKTSSWVPASSNVGIPEGGAGVINPVSTPTSATAIPRVIPDSAPSRSNSQTSHEVWATEEQMPHRVHSTTDVRLLRHEFKDREAAKRLGSVGTNPRILRNQTYKNKAGINSLAVSNESHSLSPTVRTSTVARFRASQDRMLKTASRRSFVVVNRDQNPWAVNKSSPVYEKYELLGNKSKSFLGGGTFSEVRTVVHKGKGILYALKVVKKRYLLSQEEKDMVQREVEIHQVLRHPNIVRLCEIFDDPDSLYLVLERANYGNLEKLAISRRNISEAEVCHIMIQFFRAVAYLHENGVLHADIKPSNILLDCPTVPRIVQSSSDAERHGVPITDLVVKICDFGLSRKVPDVKYYKYTNDVNLVPYTEIRGTVGYIAPEILAEKPYGIAADCWSIGIIMYELIGQMKPFMPYGDCLYSPVQFPEVVWSHKSALSINMIQKLLNIDASKRMTAKEALEDPWTQLFTLPNVEDNTNERYNTYFSHT